jgi:hypothetical protein
MRIPFRAPERLAPKSPPTALCQRASWTRGDARATATGRRVRSSSGGAGPGEGESCRTLPLLPRQELPPPPAAGVQATSPRWAMA